MVHGEMLTSDEKAKITKLLSAGKTTLKIAKIIHCDHHTVKKYINEGKVERKKHKGGRPKALNKKELRKVKKALRQNLPSTSKEIFKQALIEKVLKPARNHIFNTMAKQRSAISCPLLSEMN